jgi:4-alpha-glucanotransferase
LFDAVTAAIGPQNLVAEDLGAITPEVDALRRRLGFPGMRVLQFGFEGLPDNPHRPCHHGPDAVVYTGTHDNDTTLGWWKRLSDPARAWVLAELGHPDRPMPQALVAAAMSSVAGLAIVPLQDLLGLDSEARMNVPGTALGNWRWQVEASALDAGPPPWLRPLLAETGRLGNGV